jgi:hypothetical protein
VNEKITPSFKITLESNAPHAEEIISGMKAEAVTSASSTSMAKSTPAIGELKAAAIPAAAPHASSIVLSL